MKDKISAMDEVERKAIGALFRSIKEMRRAAKLDLAALTRLKELVIKYLPGPEIASGTLAFCQQETKFGML